MMSPNIGGIYFCQHKKYKRPQPLRQEPDPFNSAFAFGVLALMFLDTEAMQKALRRMELCKEIFDADMEFRKRMYPINGWEV